MYEGCNCLNKESHPYRMSVIFCCVLQAHTKWSERKEALESLDKLTSTPKIEAGHFGEIMGCLKKVSNGI